MGSGSGAGGEVGSGGRVAGSGVGSGTGGGVGSGGCVAGSGGLRMLLRSRHAMRIDMRVPRDDMMTRVTSVAIISRLMFNIGLGRGTWKAAISLAT